jgi:hypothetical protein
MMPDNVTAPAGGVSFATDDIGGVHFPYAKLAWGADNQVVAVAEADAARLPVAVPAIATTTRAYGYASGQRLTTTGSGPVRSAAISAAEVLLHASVRGFFRVGDNAVSASVGAGSIPLETGEKFHLRITPGQFLSFVRDGASDGSLTIMPVAP